MRQHSIDLMPAIIRARTKAGLRTGRFIAAAAACVALTFVVAIHSVIHLASAQESLFDASVEAERVFATEAKALELEAELKRLRLFVGLYDRVALPLPVSAVLATVVNSLPDSVTLDQIDVDAGSRVISRTPRSKGMEQKDVLPPRVLGVELSGFAVSDQQIVELVSRLSAMPPFRDVNLDFSRTRAVHGKDAREFRLSFKLDLDAAYDVTYQSASAIGDTGRSR